MTNILTKSSLIYDKTIKKGCKKIKREKSNQKNCSLQDNNINNKVISNNNVNHNNRIHKNNNIPLKKCSNQQTDLNPSKDVSIANISKIFLQQDMMELGISNMVKLQNKIPIHQINNNNQNQISEMVSNNIKDLSTDSNEFSNISVDQLDKEYISMFILQQYENLIKQRFIQIGNSIEHINEDYFWKISKSLIKENCYIIKYLTSGGEGDIFLGKMNDDEIVLKIYSNVEEEEFDEQIDLINSIQQPINILNNIDIIKLQDINVFIVVQEKCEFSLKEEIELFKTNKKEFTELNLLTIIFDLLDGLIEMRSHNIIHQDIKPDNILKTYSGKYVYTDFGIASKCKDNQAKAKGFTRKYCAPEQQKGNVNYQSDVYCLGKTLLLVLDAYEQNQNRILRNQSQMKLVMELSSLINLKMNQNDQKEREEIMILLKDFFQIIKKERFLQFITKFKQKLKHIIVLFPFDNSKDIHYFSNIHIQYWLLYIQTLKLEIKVCQQMHNLNKLIQLNEEIAESLSNIGLCYDSIGEQELALIYSLQGLKKKKIVYSENHSSIADSLNNVGYIYDSLQQKELGIKYSLLALEMKKIIFSGNHKSIADSLNNIGLCQLSLNQYGLALKYLLESLEMNRIIFSVDHSNIADSLHNVGLCYDQFGEYKLSLEYNLQALQIYRNLFKGNHSSIADSLNNVGLCFIQLGQYDQALKYVLDSLQMKRTLFSENHQFISDSLNNVGLCYTSLCLHDLALKYQLESLEMRRIAFLGNHSSIADSLNKVGLCQRSLSQFDLALKYSLESLEMRKILYSGNHFSVAESLNSVGLCQQSLGQYDLALKYFLESLQMKRILFLGKYSTTADSLLNVAIICGFLRLYKKALNLSQGEITLQQFLEAAEYYYKKYFLKISEYLVKKNYLITKYLTSTGEGDIFLGKMNDEEIVLKIKSNFEEKELDKQLDLINSIQQPRNILNNIDTIKLQDIKVFIVVQEKCQFSLKEEIELLQANKKEFTQLNLLTIIFDLLYGLIEMRSHNIIHQDIKPDNILKTYSGKYVYTDFEIASKFKNKKQKIKGCIQIFAYPEQQKGNVNYQSDMYSLGNTLLLVLEAYEQNQKLVRSSFKKEKKIYLPQKIITEILFLILFANFNMIFIQTLIIINL